MAIPEAEANALIQRARAGSGSSLGKLLDGYREYLLRIAVDRIGPNVRPKLAPSDVVQGSMLVATREFMQFRGDSEKELRAWLLRIVKTQVVDGLRHFVVSEKRRAGREAPGTALQGIADSGETPSDLASLHEDAERLLAVIESLPNESRDVVQARYLEGLTFQQVADRLDLPVTTCRRRWLAGIESIAKSLGKDS